MAGIGGHPGSLIISNFSTKKGIGIEEIIMKSGSVESLASAKTHNFFGFLALGHITLKSKDLLEKAA